MKRLIALIMSLLLSTVAFAEVGAFSFRNGIAWGMSATEVLAAEGGPKYVEDRENGFEVIRIADAVHEGAPCRIEYLFFDGGLAMARIEYAAGDMTGEALMDILCDRYGEATPLSQDQLKELLLEDQTPDSFYGWVLDSDTLVCLIEDAARGRRSIVLSNLIDVE